jgi:GTP-binding protein HflX
VASFKATLEEARQARLLLHVVDAANPHAEEQIKAVNKVLTELGIGGKPIVLVLNQIDRVADPTTVTILQNSHPRSVAVSAKRRQGLDELCESVIGALSADFADSEIITGIANGKVLAYLNAHAEIYRQEYHDDKVVIHCYLPRHLLHHIQGPDVQVQLRQG